MKRNLILIISIISLFTAFGKKQTSSPFNVDYTIESYGKDPGASPDEVRRRLEALPTEIEMRYTQEVQTYIDNYMKNGRKQVTNLLVLSSYYLPIFEQALKEAGLPEELKYLPVIESGLDAKATSSQGAAGLWQFMPIAARGYDMKISSTLDERRDPYISSERACRMLKDLYKQFGDWGLVLAAYNAGPGTVERAIKRAGGNRASHNFWTVRNLLPAQTKKYISLFTAMNYVMNYYAQHNIPEVKIAQPFTTDTIHISENVNLSKMAPMFDVTVEDLKKLNPQFTTNVIPATASRPCTLIVPSATARDYKIKHGRYIDIRPETEEAPAMAVATPETKRERPARTSEYAYEEVPSQIFPNTYVRKLKTDDATTRSDRRRKRDSRSHSDTVKEAAD